MVLLLGTKKAHFKQVHKKTGIPYSEMVSLFVRYMFLHFYVIYVLAIFRRRDAE